MTCQRIANVVALALVLVFGSVARSEDRDIIRETKIPRDGDLSSVANVNRTSQRRYVGYHWDAEKGQKITQTVWSHDHQPEILVFFTDPATGKTTGRRIGSSVPEQSYRDESGRWVYYSTLTFVAPKDANYKVIITHSNDSKPGAYWTEGAIWSKPKTSGLGGDLWPTLSGYQGKNYGDPEGASGPSGRNLIGVEYKDGNNNVGEVHGSVVKPEDVDKAGAAWDRIADGSQIRPGQTEDRDHGYVWLGSQSKKAFVQVVIYDTYPDLKPQLIEAGKRMLAELEKIAADR